MEPKDLTPTIGTSFSNLDKSTAVSLPVPENSLEQAAVPSELNVTSNRFQSVQN